MNPLDARIRKSIFLAPDNGGAPQSNLNNKKLITFFTLLQFIPFFIIHFKSTRNFEKAWAESSELGSAHAKKLKGMYALETELTIINFCFTTGSLGGGVG